MKNKYLDPIIFKCVFLFVLTFAFLFIPNRSFSQSDEKEMITNYLVQANFLMINGKYAEATDYCKKASDLIPQSIDNEYKKELTGIHKTLATIYNMRYMVEGNVEDLDKAIEEQKTSLQVDDSLGHDGSSGHYTLGIFYKEKGLLEEAIKEFQKVVEMQGSQVFHAKQQLKKLERIKGNTN